MHRLIRSSFYSLVITVAVPAIAAPFTVTSPEAASQKKLKVEAEFKDTADKDTLILPKLELTLPVQQGLSVAIKGHVRTVNKTDAPTETGLGDTELKVKWNFRQAGEGQVAMTIEPMLSLPTGDHKRGLGYGHTGITLPLILGYKTGAWELGSEIGYEYIYGDHKHKEYAGILVMRRVTPNLRLGSELVVEAKDHDFHHLDTRANIGFKLNVGTNGELDGLIGRELHPIDHHAENRFKISYAIKW